MYPAIEGFRPEYLDFQRGIRVGHLEPEQRITRILKLCLEARFREDFVTDRYGRGVYWQWICFLPKANRIGKPLSHHTNFGCSKFFISLDRQAGIFKSGLQVERGYVKAPSERRSWELQKDWDWHLLVKKLNENPRFYGMLMRLIRQEGFQLKVGSWSEPATFGLKGSCSADQLLNLLGEIPDHHWGGFQLYYPMLPDEIRGSTGSDLVDSIMAIFMEVTPLMNQCMKVPLPFQRRFDLS